MDHKKAIYLRLSPEFGEHRFGPYENGEIRVGSDQNNCAICIGNFGALPMHTKLNILSEKEFILSPSERSAEVFLWRKNRNPERILGATVILPGDAFSIVTPEGPKFILELDELPEEIKQQREKEASRLGVGRNRLNANAMKGEVKRQTFTQLLVFGPMQLLQRAMTFIKSGAIYQPRNIIAGVVLLSGWIIGGSMSCRSRKVQQQYTVATKELETCEQNLAFANPNDKGTFSIIDSVQGISNSPQLAQLLKKDKKLMTLVKEKALIMINQDPPDWIINKVNNPYAQNFKQWVNVVRGLDDTEIDASTKYLLTWNINEQDQGNREFHLIDNVDGEEQCGRGILQLSYRQAMYLGLQTRSNGTYKGNAAGLSSEAKMSILQKNVEDALGSATEFAESQSILDGIQGMESNFEQLDNRNMKNCVYAEGDDDRKNLGTMAKQLKKIIGVGMNGLPLEDNYLSPGARIATLYLADIEGMDFRQKDRYIKYSTTLSSSLESLNKDGQWVLDKTAKTIARSLVLPCKVALEGSDDAKEIVGGKDGVYLPNPISCLIFDWKVRNDDSK